MLYIPFAVTKPPQCFRASLFSKMIVAFTVAVQWRLFRHVGSASKLL